MRKRPPRGRASADATGRTLKESLPDARLVVLGSSEMVSDLLIQIAGGFTGEVHRSNYQLVQNLVDWSVEDTDLLSHSLEWRLRTDPASHGSPGRPGPGRSANYVFVTRPAVGDLLRPASHPPPTRSPSLHARRGGPIMSSRKILALLLVLQLGPWSP